MKNSNGSEWLICQEQFFWRFSTFVIAFLFGLFVTLFTGSVAMASSDDSNALSIQHEFDDETSLTQTIIYTLPDKPIVLEINDKGEKYRRGISVAKVLFGRANVDWRASLLPIRRMFSALESGKANFAYFVKNERSESCCVMSKKPAFFMELGVYQAIGSRPFTKLEDLKNKRVIVIESYQYGLVGQFVNDKKNNITLYTAAEHMTALSMLVAARADYLLDYRVATTGIYEEAIKQNIAYVVLRKIELYMLLSKSYPNAKAVMRRLERIYHTIPKDILNNPCVECIAGVRDRELGDEEQETEDR